jgi:hypothetical protein
MSEDQTFVRWHVGAFFYRLRLDRKFLYRLQWIDQVNAFTQGLAGHATEQGQHAYVSRRNRRGAP